MLEVISTFYLVFIFLWLVQVHGGRVSIQGVNGVGVGKQLRQERLKDVGEVCQKWRGDRSTLRADKQRKPSQSHLRTATVTQSSNS